LLKVQLGRVQLHTVAPESARFLEAKTSTESISRLLAALSPAEATEGDRPAIETGRDIVARCGIGSYFKPIDLELRR
jgi:hypothetical protein